MFSDAAEDDINQVVKINHPLLAHLSGDDLRTLRRQPGRVHSWGATEILSRDGERLMRRDLLQPPESKASVSSRIVSPIRYDTVISVLLIDRALVPGKAVEPIASYAAMRAFARTRPPQTAYIDTIPSLFDERPGNIPPSGLTAFDRGYLRALYQGRPNAFVGEKYDRLTAETIRESAQDPCCSYSGER